MTTGNPLLPFLGDGRPIILDGGLASTLEAAGHDLDDPLWSARLLLEDPAAVRAVHDAFLAAGADVITSATYQASLPGLRARGLDGAGAARVLTAGVDLAVAARDGFWADPARRAGRRRPLVAAGVGPYGAWLADGSEYDGRYGVDRAALEDFHRPRWEILAGGRADLLACETLPSLPEIEVLLELLDGTPGRWAWFSFCCADGRHLWDGTPVAEAIGVCAGVRGVAAAGVNCTAPRHVAPLLRAMRGVSDLPLLAYPNAGETYDPSSRTWRQEGAGADPLAAAPDWITAGAAGVGGCCRVGPADIARLRAVLLR